MNWLKKIVINNLFIFLLLNALFCSPAFSWSAAGHRYQINHAFQNLSASERAYYENLSLSLSKLKNKPLQERLDYLSRFPDQIRDLTLQSVFARYGADIPPTLVTHANRSTAQWHYVNNISKEDRSRCRYRNPGQLIAALNNIDRALKQPLNQVQEAILIGFQIHLIQDLHQPLHTFSQLDERCQSDLGGNKTCFTVNKKGTCGTNLHAKWDKGFGIFNDKNKPSSRKFRRTALQFNPEKWANENIKYYDAVYAEPGKNYVADAKDIIKKQNAKSIARLTHYLQRHAQQKLK